MANSFLHDPKKLDTALGEFNRKLQEEEAIYQAKQSGLPYMNFRNFPVDLSVLSMLTFEEAKTAESVVFYKDKNDLRIATINPSNTLLASKLVEWKQKYQTSIYVISKVNFESVLKFYQKVTGPGASRDETIRVLKKEDLDEDFYALKDNTLQNTLTHTEILTRVFGAAVYLGASDIHLEPENEFIKVRFRIDGVLQDVLHFQKTLQKPLVSRIKIQSKIKLNVENVPQDGRISFFYQNTPIDVRVSTLPSAFGESIVMRLLNSNSLTVGFNDLGFTGKAREVVYTELKKPNGMIITTGPTGSGKTTTLYTFLKELNEPGVKIITIEDPVEYKLDGITQTPIDHNANYDFSKALLAILRQDPDIVMVGEIRDGETADTAAQAALTGHIVLSTLHTNDAAGAVPRLYNMGVKPFVLGPALNCVIAQRLVRKICAYCKIQDIPDEKILARVKAILSTVPEKSGIKVPAELKFQKSPGCDRCHKLGYKGRIGIFEVIEINDEMRELISTEPSMVQVKKLAIANGMLTLVQDGLLKALDGVTDINEVFRVAGE